MDAETQFREQFEGRLKTATLETLPALLTEMAGFQHDYGSICLACAFAATAAAWAIEHSPSGGITGFQAGAVGWEFLRQWGSPEIGKIGARLLRYDDLLYPQYADKFTAISAETMAAAQKLASENLAEKGDYAVPEVVSHWQSVADGQVPFGLRIAAA